MPQTAVRNVLFLCTGNSARSILAERVLARLGDGRFRAFSAGSHPTGRVHPLALACLERRGYDTAGLRSKGWEELAAPGAPKLDLVVTVCDAARGESCPIWPGHPLSVHWGLPDPAAFEGPEDEAFARFEATCDALERRVRRLLELPLDALEGAALRRALEAIGEEPPPAA